MGSKWVLDYPEASEKRDIYANIVTLLTAERTAVNTAVNVQVMSLNDFTDTTGVLIGDYYDEYENKAPEWQKEGLRISAEYQSYLSELDNRITTAEGKRDIWGQRISMGHFEEEGN